MAAFPVQVLLGVYLGLLTGIIPAVVAGGMGFIFKYVTGISIPALAVVVLSLAIAGVNGGLLALVDPTVTQAPNAVTLGTAIVVVLMLSLYTHAQGDRLGAGLPRRLSLAGLRDRTLSTDVVDLVGGRGRVEITVAGDVVDMEGYPPLAPETRRGIRESEWTLPADLPISELETRVADALRTEFDLADVSVRIDERGRARVVAAPPTSGVSKRVPSGQRAVSVRALVPTGVARGDEVTLHLGDGTVTGTVVTARSDLPGDGGGGEPAGRQPDAPVHPDGEPESTPESPTTEGGEGRITVAVDRSDAERLLAAERARVVVTARGTRREYELITLLRQAGRRLRKLTVAAEAELAGTTIGDAAVRDTYGVGVLAVRRAQGWTLAPRGDAPIEAGDELFVVGGTDELARFREAIS